MPGVQLCLSTEVRNFLCWHPGRDGQRHVGRWDGKGTGEMASRSPTHSWGRQGWGLGEIARDREGRLGAGRYWQVPGSWSTPAVLIWLSDYFPFGSKLLQRNVSEGVCSQAQRGLELLQSTALLNPSLGRERKKKI